MHWCEERGLEPKNFDSKHQFQTTRRHLSRVQRGILSNWRFEYRPFKINHLELFSVYWVCFQKNHALRSKPIRMKRSSGSHVNDRLHWFRALFCQRPLWFLLMLGFGQSWIKCPYSLFNVNLVEKPHLGRVVRKPVNVNPGLNFNWSITFSCLKTFFTSNIWCCLRFTTAQNWRVDNINRTPHQEVTKLISKFSLTLG